MHFFEKFLKYLKTLQIAHIQWILARSNFYININLGKITKIFFTCIIQSMDITINNINYSTCINNKKSFGYTPNFTANSQEFIPSQKLQQYKKAQQYAEQLQKSGKIWDLNTWDLKKLEGIQHGIEVFDGVNFKQIYLLYKHLGMITTSRGCSNGCVHCYVDAKPIQLPKDPKSISSLTWEDFSSILKGFKELNGRLGLTSPAIQSKKILVPFLDSDSMEIILKDKNNIEHDMTEIVRNIHSNMNKKVLFDTAGWNPKSKRMQQRAEKYVQYILANENEFCGFNISLNPFHKLNAKYIEYIKSNPERAQIYRNLYTDRMANVFYTFTPLFENNQFRILNRALPNPFDCDPNYKVDAHRQLIKEIREKLEEKYHTSNMTPEEIEKNLRLFDEKTAEIAEKRLFPIGRLKSIIKTTTEDFEFITKNHLENLTKPANAIHHYGGEFIIDCNGKVYLFDLIDMIPTDIQLNISNRDKQTPPFISTLNTELHTDDLLKKSKESKILLKLKNIIRKFIKL